MQVRELIAELIKYDMEEDVFIGLGAKAIPSGSGKVHSVADYANSIPRDSDGKCPFGVYLIPMEHLEVADV